MAFDRSGYEGGGKLTAMFERAKEPTRKAARDMAENAGQHMVDVVKRNTPVEGFVKDLSEPFHLRDRIDLKQLRVYAEGDEAVYETGAETNVHYAPYVEEGTGLWGPEHRKYEIRPKNPHGWLSWIARKPFTRRDGTVVNAGERVFAKKVMHPGSPGQHMFAIGAAITEAEFARRSQTVLDDWKRAIEL